MAAMFVCDNYNNHVNCNQCSGPDNSIEKCRRNCDQGCFPIVIDKRENNLLRMISRNNVKQFSYGVF